jgi:hypothetical protein
VLVQTRWKIQTAIEAFNKFIKRGRTKRNLTMASRVWENFIESIAQVLSRALTDKETEKLLSSFDTLQTRLRELSVDNLKRLEDKSSSKSVFCKHSGTCYSNCISSFIRSFLISFAVKYGFALLPSLTTGKLFRKPSLFVKMLGRDTWSFALFLSWFTSSYKGILCFMRHVRNKSDALNAFAAGSIAGLSILFDNNQSRRVTIALYLATRTLHFSSRWLWRHVVSRMIKPVAIESKPPVSKPIQIRNDVGIYRKANLNFAPVADSKDPPATIENVYHEDEDSLDIHHPLRKWIRQTSALAVMVTSCSIFVNLLVIEPHTLPRSFLSFLMTHAGVDDISQNKSPDYWKLIGSVVTATTSGKCDAKYIEAESSLFQDKIPEGLDKQHMTKYSGLLQKAQHQFVMCSLEHPSFSSCTVAALDRFYLEFFRALYMYAPLNGVCGFNLGYDCHFPI